MLRIGFANKFYTLWDVDSEMQYFQDANGNVWPSHEVTHFHYIKNISESLEKAQEKHPGLEVDEDLRGHTHSWDRSSEVDLCPWILKFGKYYGRDLRELVKSDFLYVLWVSGQGGIAGSFADSLPEVVEHREATRREEEEIAARRDSVISRVINSGTLTFDVERNFTSIGEGAYYIIVAVEGVPFYLFYKECSLNYYQGYTYYLPIINGKAKRIKGKNITVEFRPTIPGEDCYHDSNSVVITSIVINK